jgi:DNA-binding GntR family transcriptional regulator
MAMPKKPIVQNSDKQTSSHRLSVMIREAVLSGEFQPGQRIKIAELSKRFEMSPMPVREALLFLEGEGLVEISAHRGAVIRKLDAKFVHNMYEIRRSLEALLMAEAATRFRADGIARLRQAQDRYERTPPGDTTALLRCNSEFHEIINTVGDNEDASRLLGRGWDLIHALRLQFGFGVERIRQIAEEHRKLIDAISEGDKDRALEISDQHCRSARDDMLARMAEG